MLPVWIVYASNFDLNIPECHIRDSSFSLYIFDSIGAQYHNMKLSLYRYRYVSQIPTHVCVCHLCAFVRMCACACVCIRSFEFECPIEYVKIYCSSGTFDTHSSLAIFDEHLV